LTSIEARCFGNSEYDISALTPTALGFDNDVCLSMREHVTQLGKN
jgi:hypothetical protein